jgi:hypothetical protein
VEPASGRARAHAVALYVLGHVEDVSRFFLGRVALIAATVIVVSAIDWPLFFLVSGAHSFWTLLGTVVGLCLVLRFWIEWRPRSKWASSIKATSARWWSSHIAWPTAHPFRAAVCDGLAIFVLVSVWSFLVAEPSDLSVAVAAECGGICFAFSASVGVIATRRANRQRQA